MILPCHIPQRLQQRRPPVMLKLRPDEPDQRALLRRELLPREPLAERQNGKILICRKDVSLPLGGRDAELPCEPLPPLHKQCLVPFVPLERLPEPRALVALVCVATLDGAERLSFHSSTSPRSSIDTSRNPTPTFISAASSAMCSLPEPELRFTATSSPFSFPLSFFLIASWSSAHPLRKSTST